MDDQPIKNQDKPVPSLSVNLTSISTTGRWLLVNCWDESPQKNPLLKALFVLILLCICVTLAWKAINPYTYQRLYTDSAIFASVSQHWLGGKALYTEVWDHKPPMMYVINALPHLFGDGSILSFRYLEKFFSVIACGAFFVALLLMFKNPAAAFVGTLGWTYYFFIPEIFQGGNVTEEYAAEFVMMAILLLLWAKQSGGYLSCLCAGLSGLLFSCAALTKEPFVLSALPWFLYLFISKQNQWAFPKVAWVWLMAALLPPLLFLLVIPLNAWLDIIFYNFAYAKNSLAEKTAYDQQSWQNIGQHTQAIYQWVLSKSIIYQFLMGLGIIACFARSFLQKTNFIPIVIVMMLILDFCAVILSGYKIGHYYLQLIPSLMMLSACGVAFIMHLLSNFYDAGNKPLQQTFCPHLTSPPGEESPLSLPQREESSPPLLQEHESFPPLPEGEGRGEGMWISLILSFIVGLTLFLETDYNQRLKFPVGNPRIGALSQRLIELKQPGDTLWCNLGDNAKYYMESGLLSPTKYIYIFDHSFLDSRLTLGEERRQKITQEITQNSPRFMILSDAGITHLRKLGFDELMNFILTNYQRNSSAREGDKYIYERIN